MQDLTLFFTSLDLKLSISLAKNWDIRDLASHPITTKRTAEPPIAVKIISNTDIIN